MKYHTFYRVETGQVAIVLVMITAIVTILFSHVALINVNSLLRSRESSEGVVLRMQAEGALESGAMRWLRDPSYAGETLTVGTADCTVSVDNQPSYVELQAVCNEAGRSRRVGVTATDSAGISVFSKIYEL